MESTTSVENDSADVEAKPVIQEDAEMKCDMREEEVGSIVQMIASTGKFWHDWDTLKGLLSFRLKQVLADYPEAQVDRDQQSSSLGETYADLVTRLDEALSSFIEGPPFTLQRLCEILLSARSVYPNLSKLALALEKNLLVTSTLTISTEPYPSSTTQKPEEVDHKSIEPAAHSLPVQNGVEPVVEDEDEEMADAEEVDLDKAGEPDITEETMNDTPEANSEQNIKSTEEALSGAAEASTEQNVEITEEKMAETAEASAELKIESTEERVTETTAEVSPTQKIENGTVEGSSEHGVSEPPVELSPSTENINSMS